MRDYRLRLDGALDELWEPVWQLGVRLFPQEKELMRSATVRRLHFIRHGGASFINSHHTYSRLQHTLGVFALAAHFDPENRALRAAALLHDAGHAPFSHTLEGLEGVDHHRWTRAAVCSEEIERILARSNVQPDEVMAYIDGTKRSLLRNQDGTLHADHLDSYVRSAYYGGYLRVSARELLSGMTFSDDSLQFSSEMGRTVADLIWEEARMHGSPANIGINAMLRKLVRRLFDEGKLTAASLPAMQDAHIEQLLRESASTREEYERLLTESWRIGVARDRPAVPAETASLNKLYLSLPLVDGVSIASIIPDMQGTINELEHMLGTYYVWWMSHEDAT